jgi:hypothetical protein
VHGAVFALKLLTDRTRKERLLDVAGRTWRVVESWRELCQQIIFMHGTRLRSCLGDQQSRRRVHAFKKRDALDHFRQQSAVRMQAV